MQAFLHIGERDDIAGNGAIAREAAERGLGCDLLLLDDLERGVKRARLGLLLDRRLGQFGKARQLDPRALDLAAERH